MELKNGENLSSPYRIETPLKPTVTKTLSYDDDDDDDDVDDVDDLSDREETDSAFVRNLPNDAWVERCSADAVKPHRAPRTTPTPPVHRQVLPPVVRWTQPEEEVRYQHVY